MIIYREFQEKDAEEIQQVAKQAWLFTYKNIFSNEFIDHFIKTNYDPKNLVRIVKFMEKGLTSFQLAIDTEKIVGYMHIGYTNYQMSTQSDISPIELHRIYLLPQYISKGIGKELLNLAEKFVLSKDHHMYSCFVHKKNVIGQKFYFKNGFIHIPEKDHVPEEELYLLKKLE